MTNSRIQDGFPHVFVCFGDFVCYYDAKHAPAKNEELPFWQYFWGSQQDGITPGHIQIMLQFKKIGSTAKREEIPSKSYRSPKQQD
jgi:hypothetical protein